MVAGVPNSTGPTTGLSNGRRGRSLGGRPGTTKLKRFACIRLYIITEKDSHTLSKVSRRGRTFVLRVREHLLIGVCQQLLTGTVQPNTHGGPLRGLGTVGSSPDSRLRSLIRAREAAATVAVALLAAQPRPRPATSWLECRRGRGGHCATTGQGSYERKVRVMAGRGHHGMEGGGRAIGGFQAAAHLLMPCEGRPC